MIVSATEMLKKAVEGKYAVGQFNINNLEWTKAILLTAQENNSPVILGVSEGAGKYMTGFKTVAAMVKAMVEELNITVPVALHLDHGTYEGCYKCIEAGFSSVMFDGSHFPIEENIAKTSELVKVCHEKGLSIEAEVGSIGGEEDGVIGAGEIADPNECKKIADLGVDFLAAGIGNIHGKYPANWKGLDFDALAKTKELIGDLPLVLHGGTGIPADMIKKAISLGVAKINVNTECQLYFQEATRKYIEEGKDLEGKGFDPRKLLAPSVPVLSVNISDGVDMPIIMYHSVLKDTDLSGKYIVTPDTLKNDINFLKNKGYTFVSAQELIDYTNGTSKLPDKPVMLTFDDGFYNNYGYVMPILSEYDAKAVISVVGSYTDEYSKSNIANMTYGYVRWSEVYDMFIDKRVEVGNHSYDFHSNNHGRNGSKRNSGESEDTYKHIFVDDTQKAQDRFMTKTGFAPIIYTYPFGAYSEETTDMLKSMGFKMSLTCNEGINHITDADSLFMLKRYNRPSGISTADFFAKMGID